MSRRIKDKLVVKISTFTTKLNLLDTLMQQNYLMHQILLQKVIRVDIILLQKLFDGSNFAGKNYTGRYNFTAKN